jgi:predicted esterase
MTNSYEWWTLPPGKRSFEATTFQGCEESIAIVEKYIESNNINMVIGHSQGAMLLAIILARRQMNHANTQPFGAILSSPAWPLPYKEMIEGVRRTCVEQRRWSPSPIPLHAVFTIGTQDKINPPSHTREIAHIFQESVSPNKENSIHVLEHPGGHILPQDNASLEFYDKNVFSHFRS